MIQLICRLADKRDPAFEKLPFANIGRTRDFWVPVERLSIAEDQILRNSGQLVSLLRNTSEEDYSKLLSSCEKLPEEVYSNVQKACICNSYMISILTLTNF